MQVPRLLESLDAFHAAGAKTRAAAGAELARALGSGWVAGRPSRDDSLPLDHPATGVSFVAIPGGRFEMGLSEQDIEEASEYVDLTTPVARWLDRVTKNARP